MVGSVDRWPSEWEKRWSIAERLLLEGASADTAAVGETVWFEFGNKSACRANSESEWGQGFGNGFIASGVSGGP